MGVNKQILGGEVVWKFSKPCPFNKRLSKSLRPQTNEFSCKKRWNKTIVLQREKMAFSYVKWEMYLLKIHKRKCTWFFFPFLPSPPFSGSRLKSCINKYCPGWCFLSWCSGAFPCPAGAAFHTGPCRTESPCPQAQRHKVCPCPGRQCPWWQRFASCCASPAVRLEHREPSLGWSPHQPKLSDALLLARLAGPLLPVCALWTAGN